MNTSSIIQKYYPPESKAFHVIIEHSRQVASFAVEIATKHPELKADEKFIYEAAMLHDIGIFLTDAPDIECFGTNPYICHGYLGRELLEKENLPIHALVCERHTGAGLTVENIVSQKLPIPQREMVPVSIEEQIICYADKFYSKSGDLTQKKDVEKILKKMKNHGEDQLQRFLDWHNKFN